MPVKLTERMRYWIEGLGCHLCTAKPAGLPTVVIARYAKVTGDDEIAFALAKDEYELIKPDLDVNPWVAIGVSHQGVVSAPYQFKGTATVVTSGPKFDDIAEEAKKEDVEAAAVIYVKIKEIYCTRPGPEAALRLDVLPYEEVVKLDQKWVGLRPPPRPK
ncbi:hypothetical protein J7L06_07595 [Candidatus Bathyarchaeota archaeon]|nr:hypothetical protein [Candidatus Bathyarchaeota archaeon]